MGTVFVTRATASGNDPREFIYGEQKYQVGLDAQGNPNGVSFFAGPAPTFLAAARMLSICQPAFIKAAETAGEKTVAAVKGGTLKLEAHTGKNNKTSNRWQMVG